MLRFEVCPWPCEDAALVRRKVFMEEQGFENEFDDIDPVARHIVLYDGGVPVATCRLHSEDGWVTCRLCRLAVMPDRRGSSLGSAMVRAAENLAREAGCRSISLSAQVRVRGFYERLGYTAHGDEYLDEWCPHVMMSKDLRPSGARGRRVARKLGYT